MSNSLHRQKKSLTENARNNVFGHKKAGDVIRHFSMMDIDRFVVLYLSTHEVERQIENVIHFRESSCVKGGKG